MRYRDIGSSGLKTSVVGLGTWVTGGWQWGGEAPQHLEHHEPSTQAATPLGQGWRRADLDQPLDLLVRNPDRSTETHVADGSICYPSSNGVPTQAQLGGRLPHGSKALSHCLPSFQVLQ